MSGLLVGTRMSGLHPGGRRASQAPPLGGQPMQQQGVQPPPQGEQLPHASAQPPQQQGAQQQPVAADGAGADPNSDAAVQRATEMAGLLRQDLDALVCVFQYAMKGARYDSNYFISSLTRCAAASLCHDTGAQIASLTDACLTPDFFSPLCAVTCWTRQQVTSSAEAAWPRCTAGYRETTTLLACSHSS